MVMALLLISFSVSAVINPALQPDVYYNSYDNIVVLEIGQIDAAAGRISCKVVKTIKGSYYPVDCAVNISFTGDMTTMVGERQNDGSLKVGDQFPVFAGKPSRRKKSRQLRMYADEFYVGEIKAKDDWQIGLADGTEKDSEGKLVNTLAGIFCGMTSELIQMLEDTAADRDFYPRKAYVKFKPDLLIDKLDQSVEGIAMFDVNGDGMEDIIACSPGGDRVYFQVKPMVFANVTEKVGLKTASVSCSVADVDCDGLYDLLLDGKIYKGKFAENQFSYEETDWLKAGEISGTKSSAFVELNGDGNPDLVMSIAGKGLRAFENNGAAAGFTEKTAELGLAALTSGGNGYFMAGDWNGDKRTDLFYSHAKGLLLVQNGSRFTQLSHDIDFTFRTGADEYGKTGAGVFLPTLKPDTMDLIVPIEKDWLVVGNQQAKPVDISRWGNEISEGSDYHLATVAEDINLDGYVDIYTISDKKKENRYIINRGYGSYMHGKVHVDEKPLFKGPAHSSGGRSVATGDINDDGAADILVGNEDGQIFLIINDTLSMRQPKEHMKKDEKRLLNIRLCSVRVLGPKGVVNAKVKIFDTKGELVGRRDLSTNIATGCQSPDMVTFAVRSPGKYKVKVEYTDGEVVEIDADLTTEKRISLVSQRDDGGFGDGF
jgi:hypothetical protein